MGEIEIQVEFSGNRFVLRELLAVVGGQGVRVIGEGAQLLKDGLRDVIGQSAVRPFATRPVAICVR